MKVLRRVPPFGGQLKTVRVVSSPGISHPGPVATDASYLGPFSPPLPAVEISRFSISVIAFPPRSWHSFVRKDLCFLTT